MEKVLPRPQGPGVCVDYRSDQAPEYQGRAVEPSLSAPLWCQTLVRDRAINKTHSPSSGGEVGCVDSRRGSAVPVAIFPIRVGSPQLLSPLFVTCPPICSRDLCFSKRPHPQGDPRGMAQVAADGTFSSPGNFGPRPLCGHCGDTVNKIPLSPE